MSCFSWNCWGLGTFGQFGTFDGWMVKEKHPNMVFLMETKLQAGRLDFLKTRLGFDGLFVVTARVKAMI
jgi:hypothetical protein